MATLGVITRPFKWPEAVWAVAGALLLVALGLLPLSLAFQSVGNGTDVYLFLSGMMLLSKLAGARGSLIGLRCLPSTMRRGRQSDSFCRSIWWGQ